MGSLPLDPVIIIGGGLGGLALAQGLRNAGIPFKVFERTRPEDFKYQGYRIRLISEGVNALRSLVGDEVWRSFEETSPGINLDGLLPTINASDLEIKQADFGGNDPRKTMESLDIRPYNHDRSVLREVLLTGLGQHIVFGKDYSHYELSEQGVDAVFTDGSKVSGKLLVGADGARSAVRKQHLPDFRLLDTRNRLIYGKTPLVPSFVDQMFPQALERLCFIKDPQTGSLTLLEALRFKSKDQRANQQELPTDYVYWVNIPSPQSAPPEKRINREEAVRLAHQAAENWHPSLKPLIAEQDPSQTGVYGLLSVDPQYLNQGWDSDGRVTLLGDAAHAMLPSEANGTGTAMRDCAVLVEEIKRHGVGLESVQAYEEAMRKYAFEAVFASAKIGPKIFGVRPLEEAVEA